MNLGRVDICLEVRNISESYNFYRLMDFKQVEGDVNEGWVILKFFNLRLGLFQDIIEGVSLNFRGGDVEKITDRLKKKGFDFKRDYQPGKDGGGSSTLLDPDGYVIFFDSTIDEMKMMKDYQFQEENPNEYEIFLGRCDFCIEVNNIQVSYDFYKKLGLKEEEVHLDEGWVILRHQNLRLAIFEGKNHDITMNFRGGIIEDIVESLIEKGIQFTSKTIEEDDGSKSAKLHDPDNYYIYLNTHPEELMVSKQ